MAEPENPPTDAVEPAAPLDDALADALDDALDEDDPADDLAVDLLEDQPIKNTADLDEISLAQALLDVDVANARVIDLTKRLTTMSKELRRTTSDLQKAKMRNRKLVVELDELEEIKGSRAYRSATTAQRMLGAARARLGR